MIVQSFYFQPRGLDADAFDFVKADGVGHMIVEFGGGRFAARNELGVIEGAADAEIGRGASCIADQGRHGRNRQRWDARFDRNCWK